MAGFWRRYGAIILTLAAIAALSAGGLYARGQAADIQLFHTINTSRTNAGFDALGTVGYGLGSFWFSLGLFTILFFLGWRRLALSAIGAIVAGALLVLLIKYLAHQPRPAQELPGVRAVGIPEYGLGYPSGHSAQAFLTVYLLCSYFSFRWYTQAGLYSLASLVALTRVYTGVHLPVDIVVGAAIGLLFGVLWVHTRLWPGPRRRERWRT